MRLKRITEQLAVAVDEGLSRLTIEAAIYFPLEQGEQVLMLGEERMAAQIECASAERK
jgi:hypothetical protein